MLPDPRLMIQGGLRHGLVTSMAPMLILCFAICFRAGNRVSGKDFGWILVGKTSKSVILPAFGRRRAEFEVFTTRIRKQLNPAPGLSVDCGPSGALGGFRDLRERIRFD